LYVKEMVTSEQNAVSPIYNIIFFQIFF